MKSIKITIEYNKERITVEKEIDGEITYEIIMGALKSGLSAAKVQLKRQEAL